jgi:hypothetical protein
MQRSARASGALTSSSVAHSGVNADADGYPHITRTYRHGRVCYCCAEALGRQRGSVAGVGGEQHRKLLASVAADNVVVTQELAKPSRDPLNYLVPHPMAESIVDFLKLVDINHHRRKLRVLLPRPPDLGISKFEEVPPDRKAREVLDRGELPYLREEAGRCVSGPVGSPPP